ncbi:MAG: hypothetical protein KGI33_08860 [Thaumarchaeota archaeon]|nr:hypothetical protein [Nitrososphaerota archaeon]
MIHSALRPKMWGYNHGKRWLKKGTPSAQVILDLYPEKKKTLREVRHSIGSPEGSKGYRLAQTIWELKARGLLSGTRRGMYWLTDSGRWIAIACKLDLSFLQTCVLACACCVQVRYAETGKEGYYMISYFERLLGEYYSKKYLPVVISTLNRKGFTSRYRKRWIRVYPDKLDEMMSRYGKYFEELESWLYELKESEPEIFKEALEGFSLDDDSD